MKILSKMPFFLAIIGVATGFGLAEDNVVICKIIMCISFLILVIMYSLIIKYYDETEDTKGIINEK